MKNEDLEYWEEELEEERERPVRRRPRASSEERVPSRKKDGRTVRSEKHSF